MQGVDTHTITGTAANVHDIDETHNSIREDDEVVYGDSGYLGIEKHDEIKNDEQPQGRQVSDQPQVFQYQDT